LRVAVRLRYLEEGEDDAAAGGVQLT
jgi:hypothetical protein